jgi:hypothetical protein
MGDTTTTTYSILPFTESFGVCGTITYSALLSDGSSLPSMITFDSTTNMFTVDTLNIPTTIDYSIKITGSLASPYPSSNVIVIFHLIGCSSTVITTPTDFSSSYTFSYGDANQDFTITPFTETYGGLCGPFTYNSTAVISSRRRMLSSSSSYPDDLPYFMTLDRTNLIFKIDTFNIYSTNTYSVVLKGNLPNGITNYITLTVNINGCESATAYAPTIATQNYYIGDVRLYVTLNGVTVNNTLCPYTTTETLVYTTYPIILES